MTIEELNVKIANKQNQIAKIEKRITRLSISDPYNDLHRAECDLRDAQITLQKYLNTLKLEEAKISATKVDVIWNFLLEYKAKVRQFLEDNKKWKHEYFRLNHIFCEMHNAHKYSKEELNVIYKQEKEAHENIHPYTDKYYNVRLGWNEPELEKQLTKDITNKYFKLIDQITKYVGEIIDASNLSIRRGELNGIIIGSNGKAKVETIGAGGWNIQCFHYRVLVKEIK